MKIYEYDEDGSIVGTYRSLARQARCETPEMKAAIDELVQWDVCDVEAVSDSTDMIRITSRRAKKEIEARRKNRERMRQKRSEDEDDDSTDDSTEDAQNVHTESTEDAPSRARAMRSNSESLTSNSKSEKEERPDYAAVEESLTMWAYRRFAP